MKTKFDIDQTVFYLYRQEVRRSTIKSISIENGSIKYYTENSDDVYESHLEGSLRDLEQNLIMRCNK